MPIRPGQAVTSTGGGGGGGGSQTLANITGTLDTLKGGTGINANDLTDLRNKLGIGTHGYNDYDDLEYCPDTLHQTRNTMQRTDSSTANIPLSTSVSGLVIKIGDDQVFINLDDGKRWVRTHTDTRGVWSTPVTASSLSQITTASQFYNMPNNGVGWINSDTWLPSFTDGSKPAKVIVGRHDSYLIACDRNNMWWAVRPSLANFDSITWHWEGVSRIPDGLYYTGGEYDEEKIPSGESAILSGKTGVDGENFITMLVLHNYTSISVASTYTGYFIDDDSADTFRTTTNTRGYSGVGDWGRTKLDADGISDDIIITDTSDDEPVFLGIVPSIDDLTFTGYTLKVNASPSAGQVGWYAAQRGVRIAHAAGHDHIDKLLKEDVELQIKKDDSNYIRGVFQSIQNIPNSGGATQAIFRQEGLQIVGTINDGDSVEILGHKAVFTKLEQIPTINIADDAITPAKINGVDAPNGTTGQVLALNTAKDGFDLVTQSSGGGGGSGTKTFLSTSYIDTSVTNNDFTSGLLQQQSNPTDAWQLANKSTGKLLVYGFGSGALGYGTFTGDNTISLSMTLQVRWADSAAGSYSDWNEIHSDSNHTFTSLGAEVSTFAYDNRNGSTTITPSTARLIDLSTLPDGATDGKYVQFRVNSYFRKSGTTTGGSLRLYLNIDTAPETASGGGGGTPADGSIGTDQLADGAVTGDKMAANAIPVPHIQPLLSSASTYTRIASGIPTESQFLLTANRRGRVVWSSADAELRAIWNTVGNIVEVEDASNNVVRMEVTQVTLASIGTDYDTYRFANQTGLADLASSGACTLRSPAVSDTKIAVGGVVEELLATGSVSTAKIEDGAVSEAKIEDGAVSASKITDNGLPLSSLSSQYKVLDDSYTFQANVGSGVDDGKFGYTDSGLNGQIAFNVKSGDSSAIAEFVDESILVLWKDATNYVIGQATEAAQTEVGDSTEGAISVNELYRIGAFADGDSVKLYYGSKTPPEGVVKVGVHGEIETGYLRPQAMGITEGTAYGGRVITTNADSTGFFATGAGHVGGLKRILVGWQTGNHEGLSGPTSFTQLLNGGVAGNPFRTGSWVMANRSSDWIEISFQGLCYCGSSNTPAPINPEFNIVMRTASTQAGLSSAGWVEVNAFGGDGPFLSKVDAGGDPPHGDYWVSSGVHPIKLTQLPAAADGQHIQFGLQFRQAPGNFTDIEQVRNFRMRVAIIDGSIVSSSY